jgi:hypothetical protein
MLTEVPILCLTSFLLSIEAILQAEKQKAEKTDAYLWH